MRRMLSAEDFRIWLNEMPQRIETFLQILPDETRRQLKYDVTSLDILEGWVLEKYPGPKAIRDDLDKGVGEYLVIDGAGSYVGETFRRNLGGNWIIELADKEYAYLGIPGIGGFKDDLREPPVY